MEKDFVNLILETLEKNMNINKSEDFIGELFEQRAEDIHREITQDKKYKKQMKRVAYINENIINQYENAIDMIKVMEEYANVIDEIEDTIEKSMYKHGLYDGLKLIIEGMKKIDIKK